MSTTSQSIATPAVSQPSVAPFAATHRRLHVPLIVGAAVIVFFVACAVVPDLIAPGDPLKLNVASQFAPPGPAHLMGTDEVGRDLWTRIVHATRYSLGTALAIVLVGAAIGT